MGKGKVADDLLDHLSQQAGILERVPGLLETYDKQYKFLHLSFQEYLTACELLYRSEDKRPEGLSLFEGRRFPAGLADRMVAAPVLWANVLRFAVDELIYRDRTDDAYALLTRCCQPYRMGGDGLQPALLALQVALDVELLERAQPPGNGDYQVLCGDAQAILGDHDRFTPEQRDIAGRLLGSDPFPGHDKRPGSRCDPMVCPTSSGSRSPSSIPNPVRASGHTRKSHTSRWRPSGLLNTPSLAPSSRLL